MGFQIGRHEECSCYDPPTLFTLLPLAYSLSCNVFTSVGINSNVTQQNCSAATTHCITYSFTTTLGAVSANSVMGGCQGSNCAALKTVSDLNPLNSNWACSECTTSNCNPVTSTSAAPGQ